jgi:hypothetical protein
LYRNMIASELEVELVFICPRRIYAVVEVEIVDTLGAYIGPKPFFSNCDGGDLLSRSKK